MASHSEYKMDKFRKIVTDPFYAGIVEIHKQVNVHNEAGLHEPLITKSQHLELVKIMAGKEKNQSGPRKNGNPEYPLSNWVSCIECKDERDGRLVGYKHGNGKPSSKLVYHKYRCRSCRRYQHRHELHAKIEKLFVPVTQEGVDDLLEALDIVWKKNEGEAKQEARRIEHKIRSLNEVISQQIEAIADPVNSSIRDDIRASIEKKKSEIIELEDKLEKLISTEAEDNERFIRFAFDFIDNMGSRFLDTGVVSRENRLRCKQIVFPAGFYVDKNKKVYTPEISYLYRLGTKKKDTEASIKSHLVHRSPRSQKLYN